MFYIFSPIFSFFMKYSIDNKLVESAFFKEVKAVVIRQFNFCSHQLRFFFGEKTCKNCRSRVHLIFFGFFPTYLASFRPTPRSAPPPINHTDLVVEVSAKPPGAGEGQCVPPRTPRYLLAQPHAPGSRWADRKHFRAFWTVTFLFSRLTVICIYYAVI